MLQFLAPDIHITVCGEFFETASSDRERNKRSGIESYHVETIIGQLSTRTIASAKARNLRSGDMTARRCRMSAAPRFP